MSSSIGKRDLRAVYVSHNDIAHPLVRSQVLPYLRGLAAKGWDVHLVTFERGAQWFPASEFLVDRWHALRAAQGSGLAAKLLDALRGVALVARLVSRHDAALIHARSYLPAFVAALAGRIARRPFVFDMRGFLGEEYVESGHWGARDARYAALRLTEGWLLRQAAEVVVLTKAAARRLREDSRYARFVVGKEITVVPCGTDLARFRPSPVHDGTPTLVYSGSVRLSYRLDAMLRVYDEARRARPALRFLLLNRDEHASIDREIRAARLTDADIGLRGATYDEMPAILGRAHVGIALLRQTPSKVGSSAVKVAEYLACGLPVVVNEGHGDMADLVRAYRAGHVVREYTDAELRVAGDAVAAFVEGGEAGKNARRLAEAELDIALGVGRYASIYERLARR